MITATVAGQAPFRVFRETDAPKGGAREGMRTRIPRAGNRRSALERHASIERRLITKDLEPMPDHALSPVLRRPNPVQSGAQLWQVTHIWMLIRGECFWVLANEDGTRGVEPGSTPGQIWPVSPDVFRPIFDRGTYGNLIGWEGKLPNYIPFASQGQVRLELHEVVQFKLPNPMNILRGLSRLSSVALSMELDLASKQFQAFQLENNAIPEGFLKYDGTVSPEREAELLDRWEERHRGPRRAGRLALLTDGLQFQDVQRTPQEMQTKENRDANRQEILAVMGVGPSVLGLEDVANYATALIHDSSFWHKAILPLLRSEEDAVDSTLLFPETDDVVGLFDLTGIEAFRAGLQAKIDAATALAGDRLHVPPALAYQLVGLEVPEYEGDQVALVSATLLPMDQATAPPEPAATTEAISAPAVHVKGPSADRRRATRWRQFVRVQVPHESRARKSYRGWVSAFRSQVLSKLRETTQRALRTKAEQLNLADIVPGLEAMRTALRSKMRPIYGGVLQAAYDFTLQDVGGVPVFELDDPKILAHFRSREQKLLNSVPATLRKNVINALTEGIHDGLTTQQLALRLSEVFNIAAGSPKALAVARTETAGLMNAVRNEMLVGQGFGRHSWVNAGDETVRHDHVVFGKAGPQDIGFNFLTLVNRTDGTLEYPGDPSGPADQTINCFPGDTRIQGRPIGGLKAWYSGPVRQLKTRNGKRLTLTINHPVLTDRGLVAAGQLREGDRLVCQLGQVGNGQPNRQAQYRPSSIEDVFEAFATYRRLRTLEVGALDLHGDARFTDGEVRVVFPDGDLLRRSGDEEGQLILEHSATRQRSLHAPGGFLQFGERAFSAGARGPSGRALTVDVDEAARPLDALRFGLASEIDVCISEDARQGAAAYVEFLGQLVDAGSGQVEFDDLVEVRELTFSGHVFDVQTETGWVVANGIYGSNCRCLTLPEA